MGTEKRDSKTEIRFEMIKKRHLTTFQQAVSDGKADKKMISLCKFVSKTKNYFTSSSCSGRILLLALDRDEKKKVSAFHRKWHRKVKFKEVREALDEKTPYSVWLKQEAFILHIGAGDLKHAKKILSVMTKSGIKRGGIIVAKPGKFIVELQGTQGLAVPVKIENEILVSDEYLKQLVDIANEKFDKNDTALKRFEKVARDELK
ncbi:MAG: hypothetical protein V1672_02055 [Candidatus Diapherotrites archaeon]